MVTASLTNYRQSPRKVRLVASLIKGKTVPQALDMLSVTVKRASDPLIKLVESALANAKNRGIATEGLYVKECTVNQGLTMKRMMPGARGTGFRLKKKTCHVHLVLDQKGRALKALKASEEKSEKTPIAAEAPKKAVKSPKKAVAKKN